MHLTLRSRCVRGAAAGALSVALVSVGSAGAVAATDPSPMPTRTHTSPMPTRTHSPMPTRAAAAITARVSHTSMRSGQEVTLSGRASHLATGTRLTVQRDVNGKWTTLRTTTVQRGGTFSVPVKLTGKGTERLRVTQDGTHSRTVTVRVS
ncbi:hypothetical protein C1I97_10350 [Streptomyces sp. NTH33]|uniref:hypothetical protein n=1 Tax=Streptomyces sp. NTH33 TaxID=1735453 RepID=UPI000DA7ED1C|nr:hypothetical protein [Streptomyces sp. NTH33]PZH14628.1 hypothetical protein C1I97_10350 [Streptomyces sp. NTH33]